jgi:hypothetical protein
MELRIEGGAGLAKREPAGCVIVGAAPMVDEATAAPAAGAGAVVGAGARAGDGEVEGT